MYIYIYYEFWKNICQYALQSLQLSPSMLYPAFASATFAWTNRYVLSHMLIYDPPSYGAFFSLFSILLCFLVMWTLFSTTAQSWNEHIVALLILFPAWILSYSSSAQLSLLNIRLVVAHLILIILSTIHQKSLQQLPPLWPPRLSQYTIQLFNLVPVYLKKES